MSYYLYYANPSAGAPPAMTNTNVYRWFDDCSSNLLGSYTTGRVHMSGPSNGAQTTPSSFVYNAGNFTYDFDTTNDHSDSLRPTGIAERDVLTTYSFFQTGAWPTDMCSGPLVRLTTDGGAPAVENATGFYLYMLCNSNSTAQGALTAYQGHGDIAQNSIANGGGLIDGAASGIPQVTIGSWHSVGMAAWGAGGTNLKGWYSDAPAANDLGLFGLTATLTGTQATLDTTASGQAGVYLCQDIGSVANILIRRYTEPEPASALGAVENAPPPPPPPVTGPGAGNTNKTARCGCSTITQPGPFAVWAGAILGIGFLLLRRQRSA
jgi:hypothetical protein